MRLVAYPGLGPHDGRISRRSLRSNELPSAVGRVLVLDSVLLSSVRVERRQC